MPKSVTKDVGGKTTSKTGATLKPSKEEIKVIVRIGQKVNLGNFESFNVEVETEEICLPKNRSKAFKKCVVWCQKQVAAVVSEVREQLAGGD